ncbi:DUF222 domain-containing protein [Microbispora sp. CA-135349]|uniref:DUF222 domain-containing protein n=1 Tax=Microbispora sp. CA-135349 TaxID=3239953 RepID=UPI003D8D0FE5
MAIPEGLAAMAPGAELAGLLAGIVVERVSGFDTVEVLKAAYRQSCHDRARFLQALLEVGLREQFSGDGVVRLHVPEEFAPDEARAALVWSRRRADSAFDLAWNLHRRLPVLGEAMLAGTLDEPRAVAFIRWTGGLTDAQAGWVCEHLIGQAATWTVGELVEQIQRLVLAIDPGWAERRYREAVRRRRVVGMRNDDGTATVSGLDLPLERAVAGCERIDELARACKRAGDRRPVDHIRADLFLGSLDGSFEGLSDAEIIAHVRAHPFVDACDTSSSDAPAGSPDLSPAPPPPTAAGKETSRGTADETSSEPGDQTGEETGAGTGDQTGVAPGSESGKETSRGTADETSSEPSSASGDQTGEETGAGTSDQTGVAPGSESGKETSRGTADETSSEPGDQTGEETGEGTSDQTGSGTAVGTIGETTEKTATAVRPEVPRETSGQVRPEPHAGTRPEPHGGTRAATHGGAGHKGGSAARPGLPGGTSEPATTPGHQHGHSPAHRPSEEVAHRHRHNPTHEHRQDFAHERGHNSAHEHRQDFAHERGHSPEHERGRSPGQPRGHSPGSEDRHDFAHEAGNGPGHKGLRRGLDHAGERPVAGWRWSIPEIRVELTTLLGLDEHPAHLPGWGMVHAAHARRIVAGMLSGQWRYAICADDGHLLLTGITRRRPCPTAQRPPRDARGGIVELQITLTRLRELATTTTAATTTAATATAANTVTAPAATAANTVAAAGAADWAPLVADLARRCAQLSDTGHPGPQTGPAAGPQPAGSPESADRRHAGAALRRYVQIRGRVCSWPGCRMPATRTDQDHIQAWADNGVTTAANLHLACRHDHRARHLGGWRVTSRGPQLIVWTSPLGHTYARPLPAIIQPAPQPQPRHWPDAPPGRLPADHAGAPTTIMTPPHPPTAPTTTGSHNTTSGETSSRTTHRTDEQAGGNTTITTFTNNLEVPPF